MKQLQDYIKESLLDSYDKLEQNQDVSIWFDECNANGGYSYELKNDILTISRTGGSVGFDIMRDVPSCVKKVIFNGDCFVGFSGKNLNSDMSKYETNSNKCKWYIDGSFKNDTVKNANLCGYIILGSQDGIGSKYIFKNSVFEPTNEIIIRQNVIKSIEDLTDGVKFGKNASKYLRIWFDGDHQDIGRFIQKYKKTGKIQPIFDQLNAWLPKDMKCVLIYSYARQFVREPNTTEWIEGKAWS